MTRKIALISLLLLPVLMAGCGTENIVERAIEEETGGNADVDIDSDGSVNIETDEGTFSTDGELPEDWPSDVAVYAGASVQYSASVNPETGEPGTMAVLLSEDAAAEVKAFYTEKLKADGWAVESTIEAQGISIIVAKKDTRTVSLSITPSDTGSSITIGISEE